MTGDREQELVATFGAEPGVDEVIPISALQGRNVGAVERWAVSQLPLGPSLYPKVRLCQVIKQQGLEPHAKGSFVPAKIAVGAQCAGLGGRRWQYAWGACVQMPMCQRDALAQDTVSEHPERFFVAEIIREKIFQQYREEVPYCTSVSCLALLMRLSGFHTQKCQISNPLDPAQIMGKPSGRCHESTSSLIC